jgi:hypothetical protein
MGGYCCINNTRTKTLSEKNVFHLSSIISPRKIENIIIINEEAKEQSDKFKSNEFDKSLEKENENKNEYQEEIFEIIPENNSSSRDFENESHLFSDNNNDYRFNSFSRENDDFKFDYLIYGNIDSTKKLKNNKHSSADENIENPFEFNKKIYRNLSSSSRKK